MDRKEYEKTCFNLLIKGIISSKVNTHGLIKSGKNYQKSGNAPHSYLVHCRVSRDVYEAQVLRDLSTARPLPLNDSSSPAATPVLGPPHIPLHQASLTTTTAAE